ncbi:MAG: molecular chaperone [Sphingomonadaceae bacterium]|nr:molecular chaperone [Sphingomonadaceae bacterium]
MIKRILTSAGMLALLAIATPVQADLVLSKVVVDFPGEADAFDDIEVFNTGEERIYVVAEPSEILNPGEADQQRVKIVNFDEAGLLVSPQRLILEPGERRVIRIAALGPAPDEDRVYRITIKPVTGAVSADRSALKVLVGYDALVIRRPGQFRGQLDVSREGRLVVFRNGSNTAQELFDGIICQAGKDDCVTLTGTRLYPGNNWQLELPTEGQARFRVSPGASVSELAF